MTDLPRLRNLLGASTALWASEQGLTQAEGWWAALSGAQSVEYNVALCHGASAGSDMALVLEKVKQASVPTIVMAAGEALADVQLLVRAGWICVGVTPLMARAIDGGETDAAVRRLKMQELPVARAVVEQAFSLAPGLAAVALPESAVSQKGNAVWGLFDEDRLSACAAFVRVSEAVIGWSVATPHALRGRGFAARLIGSALAESAREGATLALVYASDMGAPLYRSLGFEVLEHWQLWSRPRWVLARV